MYICLSMHTYETGDVYKLISKKGIWIISIEAKLYMIGADLLTIIELEDKRIISLNK